MAAAPGVAAPRGSVPFRQRHRGVVTRLPALGPGALGPAQRHLCRGPLGSPPGPAQPGPRQLWREAPALAAGAAGLAFASELSAFEAAGLASRRQLCAEGLRSYALWGAVAAPHTLLEGVEVFPAGHYAVIHAAHGNTQATGKVPALQDPQPFEAPLGPPGPWGICLPRRWPARRSVIGRWACF